MKTAFQQFIATSEAYQQTDKLENMLVELYHPFSIIGLTETKIKSEQDNVSVLNTAMHGYHFVSQPSLSNAGGVGMYISENYKYTIRDDLSKSSKEFETLWLEIHNDSEQNFLWSGYL
jgi:hypothetical protein